MSDPVPWIGISGHRRPKVLVVDDQPINIRVVYEALRGECDVSMATDGEQALQVFRQTSPDLVLLDVVMPGMSGLDVCRQLKANGDAANVPVIFITGQQSEEDELAGLEAGAVDFIGKPIHPPVLRARIRTHLMLKLQSDHLRVVALRDGLTGISNRKAFDDALARAWRRALRERLPLSLLMIDVDFFKRYNDRYGHLAGDDCLRRVAKALEESGSRPFDLTARYGGEEFACLLADTDQAGACTVARNVLDNVRALAIPHEASEAADIVTVSIGVAEWMPLEGDDCRQLILAADEQLYAAKHAGRNRYCVVSEPVEVDK